MVDKKEDIGPYSIGSPKWNGLAKLMEECAEVIQIGAKLIGSNGDVQHWEGGVPLDQRLEKEIGDVYAAARFMIGKNSLSLVNITVTANTKKARFETWDKERRCG